jgi:hypothetical protein
VCGVEDDDDDRNEEWFRVGVAGFSERTSGVGVDFVSRVRRGGDDDDDDDDDDDEYFDDEYVVIHKGCS